jgi:hypothetical protein
LPILILIAISQSDTMLTHTDSADSICCLD